MTNTEFLETLRNSLIGELPDSEIQENIRFYDDYIRTECLNKSEEDVLKQLGSPRLIAKTIIETYQLSHGPLFNNMKHNGTSNTSNSTNQNSYQGQEDTNSERSNNDNRYNNDNRNNKSGFFYSSHTWLQKLIIAVVVVILFVLFIFLSTIMLRVFITFGVPLLLIYFIVKLINNRRY